MCLFLFIIADFNLTVVSDNVLMLESKGDMKKFQVNDDASTVNLECSLGLASHMRLLDEIVRLKFVFTSSHSDTEKIVWCNESSETDNWVVTPDPEDNTCHLKIVNFSTADGGQYDCIMYLINSHTSYSEDRSNIVVLAPESVLKPSTKHNSKNDFGHFETGVFYGILILTIAIVVAFSAIVVVRIKKRCIPPRPDPSPPGTLYYKCNQE